MSDKKPINLSLPSELIERVKIASIMENRTVSEIVTDLLNEYLDAKHGSSESD